MPFTIVAENCTGCTACEKRCPTKAISGDPKKAYYIEATLCIDCGACGVICPDEAILDTYGNVTKVLKRQERPIADRPPGQLQRLRRLHRRLPVRLHLPVARQPGAPTSAGSR